MQNLLHLPSCHLVSAVSSQLVYLQLQVDELRADRTNEVTARQVQEVLRRWATELDWSADCFGSGAREQIHGVQNTLIAVMQRIESMIDAENSRANT